MWPNPQFPADLVTFTEEMYNIKLHFLCSFIDDFKPDDFKLWLLILLLAGLDWLIDKSFSKWSVMF